MQIHIDRGGQRFGPYSIEQVKAHLADGTILPTDLGWTDGMTDWVPVTQVPGVATAAAAAAAPPPPSPPAAEGLTCPKCQAEVTVGQVVCMGCGTNLQSGETAFAPTATKSVGNKKLLVGIGAGVGVLALAAVGVFVVYPKLTADDADSNTGDSSAEEQSPSDKGGPGMGMGKGGRQKGGFGGQGQPKGGGGNMLARFDQDKDGKLSRAEVPQQMSQFFDSVDKNRDGFIDQTEFQAVAAMMGGGQPKGGGQKGGFGGQGGGQGRPKGKGGGFDPMRYDRNKDGKISRNEVPQQMSRFFDMADKNKDGFLDQTEMQGFGAGCGGFGGKGRPPSGGPQRTPQGGPQGQPQPRNP
jgi:Ca2+-binding EF-hand superfamily protein